MAVKELFAKHGVENAVLIAEIEGLLTAAESKKTDGIPQSRFNQVVEERNTLRADIAEMKAELDGVKAKSETDKQEIKRLKDVEKQYTTFKTAEEKKVLNAWEEKAKIFAVPDSDPSFEKVSKIRGKFKFPEKDGQLTAEQAQHNLEIYSVIEETGYFGESATPAGDKLPTGTPPTGKYKNPFI